MRDGSQDGVQRGIKVFGKDLGEEETSLIRKHRRDSGDEVFAMVVLSGKVPADHFIGDREEGAMRAVRALDSGLFADAAHPFVATGGRVTGASDPLVFETPGIEFLASSEQGAEEGDLCCGGL